MLCIVCTIVIILQSYWQSIDLSESRTFLIESPDTGAPLVVVSLRGSERAVNFSVLEHKSQQYFFPIEKKIETRNVFETNNPRSSLLADFKPWGHRTTGSLSIVDRFKLWWYVFSLDAAAFAKHNVRSDTAAQLTTIQKYFADTTLRSNAPTIAVINTTDRNGAASQVGDRLGAWGMRVIQVDSDQERDVGVTQLVVGDALESSRTVELLSVVLPNIQLISDETQTQRYRAMFVLFIGDEYPN